MGTICRAGRQPPRASPDGWRSRSPAPKGEVRTAFDGPGNCLLQSFQQIPDLRASGRTGGSRSSVSPSLACRAKVEPNSRSVAVPTREPVSRFSATRRTPSRARAVASSSSARRSGVGCGVPARSQNQSMSDARHCQGISEHARERAEDSNCDCASSPATTAEVLQRS